MHESHCPSADGNDLPCPDPLLPRHRAHDTGCAWDLALFVALGIIALAVALGVLPA
jgi:hypothetical protein